MEDCFNDQEPSFLSRLGEHKLGECWCIRMPGADCLPGECPNNYADMLARRVMFHDLQLETDEQLYDFVTGLVDGLGTYDNAEIDMCSKTVKYDNSIRGMTMEVLGETWVMDPTWRKRASNKRRRDEK
jgi:hypothetical protein